MLFGCKFTLYLTVTAGVKYNFFCPTFYTFCCGLETLKEGGEAPHPNETATQKEKQEEDDEEPKPKLLPAHSKVCTWNPDEVVDLAIGESGIEAEEPITVGQLFKNAVYRFPDHPALKYKEDGTWKTITYTEYYNLCIKAAKSFLMVRVGECVWLFKNWPKMSQMLTCIRMSHVIALTSSLLMQSRPYSLIDYHLSYI